MSKRNKKACLIYTRFGQTDGVSLQSLNFRQALKKRGLNSTLWLVKHRPTLPAQRSCRLRIFHIQLSEKFLAEPLTEIALT